MIPVNIQEEFSIRGWQVHNLQVGICVTCFKNSRLMDMTGAYQKNSKNDGRVVKLCRGMDLTE